MDHNSIPVCALNRNIGTVIVRSKMCEEVISTCCQREECPASGCPVDLHRPSGCELCSRTRLISQYSDCDSDIVDKCRPYRSSSARSRYVNVCAAVCLLLLVGGLSPQSSAAPNRSRSTMDRQRRATESANGAPKENSLWANPCDFNDINTKPAYSTKNVQILAVKTKSALQSTSEYKDSFASELYSFKSFDELLNTWESSNWLRNYSWFREEVLPKEKIFNQTMPDEYVKDLVRNKIDDVMPSMYKGLKMIVAGFNAFSKEAQRDSNWIMDEDLNKNISQTMHNVRAVLCYFSNIMKARELEIMPVHDSEVPNFTAERMSLAILLYRDTLNYLEYLSQVFEKLYELESA